MITAGIILAVMALLPFIVKLIFLYVAYVQWALVIPIPFSLHLFRRETQQKTKKSPMGFANFTIGDEIKEPTLAKKK